MKRLVVMGFVAAGLALGIAGCGDRPAADPQVSKKAVQPAWDAAAGPFVVPGWKSGDKASWGEQMARRAQNQNDYLRVH